MNSIDLLLFKLKLFEVLSGHSFVSSQCVFMYFSREKELLSCDKNYQMDVELI